VSDPTRKRGADSQAGPRGRGPSRTLPPPVLISSSQSGEVGLDDQGSATAGALATVTAIRAAPKGSSDRILLAEDNPVNQRVTVAMLVNLGFCVDVVEDGVEAVSAAALVPYRAILMDCQIPVLNGYESTVEIRGREGASRSTPIIAITSSATESDFQHCIDVGMNGLLAKPVSVNELAAALTAWAPDQQGPSLDTFPVIPQPTTTTGRQPPDGSARPALDPEVVERLERLGADTGEDLMGQVAELFLADADTRIVTLREALARQDGSTLIQSAHTMCGASASLGAADLARLCARLATDGAVSDIEEARSLLSSVEVELARVRAALRASRTVEPQTEAPVPATTHQR
jgi:CheY-like chemotaxis protein/HPt (histidine-containing phosphotransfer) domain-containing protein